MKMAFKIMRLDSSNVASRPRNAKREGKLDAEMRFHAAYRLFSKVLPGEVYGFETYRRWLHAHEKIMDEKDQRRNSRLFLNVAMNYEGRVVGAAITTYTAVANLALFNLISVKKEWQGNGIGKMLIRARINASNEFSVLAGNAGIKYIFTEIERPEFTKNQEVLRRRMEHHDKNTQVRAVVALDGNVLGRSSYLFAFRNMAEPNATTMLAKDVGKILYWYHQEYIDWPKIGFTKKEGTEILSLRLNRISPEKITPNAIAKHGLDVLKRIPARLKLELMRLPDILPK